MRASLLRALTLFREKAPPGRQRRVLGALLGLLMLTAAVWAVASQRPVLDRALGELRAAPPWLFAGALLLPLASWLTTSLAFWLLSNRYARVPLSDMTSLIGAAWLLNHLPLRPGMVGRIAFHKKYHGLAVRDAIRVLVAALALSGVSLGMLLVVAIAVSGLREPALQILWLCVPTGAVAIAAALARAGARPWWRELAALAARSLDMLAWVARYAIVFLLVGKPLSVEHVVAVTAVCQVAMIVPLTGNGLGLREWAVGLTLAAVSLPGSREEAGAVGLAADLINRAAETLLVVPVGLVCSCLVARSIRRRGAPQA